MHLSVRPPQPRIHTHTVAVPASQGAPRHTPRPTKRLGHPAFLVPRILYCCAAEITGGQCGFAQDE